MKKILMALLSVLCVFAMVGCHKPIAKVEKETMAFEWKLLDLAVEYGVEVE